MGIEFIVRLDSQHHSLLALKHICQNKVEMIICDLSLRVNYTIESKSVIVTISEKSQSF